MGKIKTKPEAYDDLKRALEAFTVDDDTISIETVTELICNYFSTDDVVAFTDFVDSEV